MTKPPAPRLHLRGLRLSSLLLKYLHVPLYQTRICTFLLKASLLLVLSGVPPHPHAKSHVPRGFGFVFFWAVCECMFFFVLVHRPRSSFIVHQAETDIAMFMLVERKEANFDF